MNDDSKPIDAGSAEGLPTVVGSPPAVGTGPGDDGGGAAVADATANLASSRAAVDPLLAPAAGGDGANDAAATALTDGPTQVLATWWSGAGAGDGPFNALMTTAGEQLNGLVAAGGPVVIVLGVLSVVALAILLLKLWQFSALRLGSTAQVEAALAAWHRRDTAAALAAVADSGQPVAQLLHLALRGLVRPATDLPMLREELARVAAAQMEHLRSYLRALEVIGTLAPLLGLLGTVLGMIEAFRQLEAAGSQVDPALLSGGIWQALLTTAVGLIVAIPTVLAHGWLERRVERCGHQMEDAVTRALTHDLVRDLAGEPVAGDVDDPGTGAATGSPVGGPSGSVASVPGRVAIDKVTPDPGTPVRITPDRVTPDRGGPGFSHAT